ncbi:malonyl-[acyl-carrier protein] O-methyltransferase BioC [Marinomonas sp. CT5]|uniref:malonyl-ACP O-methyltransferase BioC n=1 Tax=Marinomonas sp. CT5 TaxID=2066133 RepID=UPI001BAEDF16|nr:malonyl-ACP O-methyltransferase BioC [Marinomonas sp. CT5]QUX96855.1 malonyl-[acyl-carrier protein] O-methyltransferase BioC [Marinomonas sp. CT5]
MLITPDISTASYKRQLAKRFDRASLTYDAYADFQKIVLDRLLMMQPLNKADVVLDLGTGTGQALTALSETLSPTYNIALDLSSRMLVTASERYSTLENTYYVCADAENLPLQSDVCDLVFSSLAIQWCLNPLALFKELYRVVRPGGYVVFSTLSQGSMLEISKAWSGIDDKEHIHQYVAFDTLIDNVTASGLNLLSSALSDIPMWFDSPESAIHSLKKVGASFISSERDQVISPSKWKAFLYEYERQRSELGIPLSYQVAFVVAQRPNRV